MHACVEANQYLVCNISTCCPSVPLKPSAYYSFLHFTQNLFVKFVYKLLDLVINLLFWWTISPIWRTISAIILCIHISLTFEFYFVSLVCTIGWICSIHLKTQITIFLMYQFDKWKEKKCSDARAFWSPPPIVALLWSVPQHCRPLAIATSIKLYHFCWIIVWYFWNYINIWVQITIFRPNQSHSGKEERCNPPLVSSLGLHLA